MLYQLQLRAPSDRSNYPVVGPTTWCHAEVAVAFDSYDHWQNQAHGLKEVRRVLKSKGLFVVVKDGGLPNGADAKKEFLAGLSDAAITGFVSQ